MKRVGVGVLLLLASAWASAAEGNAAGVKWVAPASWKVEPERPMRVTTYSIPAAPGSESGECGVFYFGQGQGGSVEENLTRWAQQFEAASAPKKTEKTVRGLRVHMIDVSGTYLASGGPMMKSQGKKPGYRLIGAIVEAPRGLIFFKCTGPAATLGKAQADFESLVGSFVKTPAVSL